ncbi:MAG: terminase family protein [Dehalococcoidales bacterium]
MSSVGEIIDGVPASDLHNLGASDQARLEEALRHGWRLTPATLGQKITNGRWVGARHLLYISTILATEIARGDARIIMTMPARHGKSELISVNTPIWFLERWPGKFVMSISYGSELATDFSLKVRDTLQNEDLHHLLRTRIRQDKKRVDRWLTPQGGGLTAAGIGGPLTGRGADLMLIDDYIKNAEDSMSEGQLKKTWEWFKSTAYTRLEPGASLIILATRWNQRDLIGKCITDMPHENWRVINLPALAEVNDPLGREVGEALWPERYNRERLLRIKGALGSYWWSAMYQQRPKASMAGADLGDFLKVISKDELPPWNELKRTRAWDMAATEGGGDYTAGPKVAYHQLSGTFIIEDMQHFQKSPANNERLIKAAADLDGHGVPVVMEQEPGSSGVIVIANYSKILGSYAFKGEKATGPIEVRASPFLAAVELGKVLMIKGAWNQNLKDEMNGFPDGENDDQIVALALGYNKLVKGLYGGLTWGREGIKGSKPAIRRGELPPDHAEAYVPQLTWG